VTAFSHPSGDLGANRSLNDDRSALRVIAVLCMGRYEVELPGLPRRRVKPVAGWSPEAGRPAPNPRSPPRRSSSQPATIVFGLWPDPLFDATPDVESALPNLR
jgi:hypothetical protein